MKFNVLICFLLGGCFSSAKPESARKDPDEKFSISAARIKLAREDCKSNGGIKVIVGGPKDRTLCKNGAVFLGEKGK